MVKAARKFKHEEWSEGMFQFCDLLPKHLNLIVWIAVTGLAKLFGKSYEETEINFEIISLICEE